VLVDHGADMQNQNADDQEEEDDQDVGDAEDDF